MPLIRIRSFSGIQPKRSSDLQPIGSASVAMNARLVGGDLEPYLAPAATTPATSLDGTAGTIRSIYRFGQSLSAENQFWFQSANVVDYVKGPIASDVEERTFWTGDGYPKKTRAGYGDTAYPYPTNSLRMGVKKPTTAALLALQGTATNPASDPETAIYCYTYVTAWGEESAPSPNSASVDRRAGQSVVVSGLGTSGPAGSYLWQAKRLYRSVTGSAATKYQLVTELPIGTASYTDNFDGTLGSTLATAGFDEPPDDMTNLTVMANGLMAASVGSTVLFAEPGYPYAWPVRYRRPVDAPIVGMAAMGQSLFVGTTNGVYMFTGADPQSISSERLPVAQSCASKRSVAAMNGGIVFASPDGLFALTPGGSLANLTEQLMSTVEWRAYVPSSMQVFETDGGAIVFFDTGVRQGGLVFTFGDEPSLVETDVYATAGFRDAKRDTLYLVVGQQLRKWNAGTPLTLTWKSSVVRVAEYCNMGAARVEAAIYPLTFKLYADGVLKHTQTVTSFSPFRLPGDYLANRYEVEISGTATVRAVEVATSMIELAQGG